MGQFKAQEGRFPVSGRALPALAPYRLLHVGHQRGTVNAHCLGLGRFYHRYRQRQLCLVCLCVHRPAGLCLCPTLSGGQGAHATRIHGLALRTVYAQHSGVVHHCHHRHLVACADALCRRHSHPSGLRHSHVDVGPRLAGHLGLLHHARWTESRSLYQCLSDDTAHRRLCHTGHCRTRPCRRHFRTCRQGACRLLGHVQAQLRRGLPLVAHHPRIPRHGRLVLVYRPEYGATRTGRQGPARRSAWHQLHRLAEDS